MAARITPIERAIAGEPLDRRRRHEAQLAARGIKRVAIHVRSEHVRLFQQLATLSRHGNADAWPSIMADPIQFLADVNRLVEERTERSDGAPHAVIAG